MNKNNWRLFFLSAVLVSVMISCEKDEEEGLSDDDESKMIDLMHSMMRNMVSLTMTNDPDNDFAMMMREHLNGAISMGNLELKEGNDATLQQTA